MTDKEVIKALECCVTPGCDNCPYDKYEQLEPCHQILMKDALDLIKRQQEQLNNYSHNVRTMAKDFIEQQKIIYRQQAEINRQKAEIEKLQLSRKQKLKEIERLKKGWKADVIETENTKAEAIKEFADRLKSRTHEISCNTQQVVTKEDINNLVNEMVGEDK